MRCRHPSPPVRGQAMSDERDAMVEERLSVFDDEPDLNDWVEVMCGPPWPCWASSLVEPGNLVDPDIMRWLLLPWSLQALFGRGTASRTWP